MSFGLRTHGHKHPADLSKKFVKVDSPIAKYDSAGILSCIVCMVPIKPNVWKVHVNSKQHKLAVDIAKQKSILKCKEKIEITTESNVKECDKKVHAAVKRSSTQIIPQLDSIIPPKISTTSESGLITKEILPEKFFDQSKSSKSEATDRNQDEEWMRFQREIREAANVSNIIVAEEQEDGNAKRHLKEIDEQIDKWNRFIKINDRKNILLRKQRKHIVKTKMSSDSSSSEEESSVDDLYNWRIKSLHK